MKIKVLAVPHAIVKDLEHLDHNLVKYVGKKQDTEKLSCVCTNQPVELDISNMRYRNYYLKHLKAGDLLPADDFTANLVGR